ncbi:cation diffusion facilitator family transporter [Paraperlucidibaca wandonensis]|jgi:cation diffusion facilitator family transporter|uniref:Cation diffusion facilitator family transporter n=1 Tax=Paraperlucidibaca wandonensis TaxID=1268273 RepID=A0ABW3HHQ1_9GAMM|tara:strand:- start:99 stop:956 length:858 start_codon:yes stop_codon:yes gene_type:complete
MAVLSIITALATMALKTWAWSLTGSISILSDALESLVNLAAAGFALYVLTIAAQPADAEHPFGHDKAEYFAAAAEGLLIIVAAVGIAAAAWGRLQSPAPLTQMSFGLLITVLASALNGATAWKLFRVAREEDSLVLRADAEHLLSDVWTSVAIVAGLAVIWLLPSQAWLDPILALAVSVHLFLTGLRVLAPALAGLMDEALPANELRKLDEALAKTLPTGTEVSALRTRKSGRRRFVDGNLLVPGQLSVGEAHTLCDEVEDAVRAVLPECDITLHMAPMAERERH